MSIFSKPSDKGFASTNPFEAQGFDTTKSVESDSQITVNDLARIAHEYQDMGLGNKPVDLILVNSSGAPLMGDFTVVGAGVSGDTNTPFILFWPGTVEEWINND